MIGPMKGPPLFHCCFEIALKGYALVALKKGLVALKKGLVALKKGAQCWCKWLC